MKDIYVANPEDAVRSQQFIQTLHNYIASSLKERLNKNAEKENVKVITEAELYSSSKPKKVDIGIIHPVNGPIMQIGVRSQMSSIAKNTLTYYEGIIGECISLQDRFPLCVHGYVYLMPKKVILGGKEKESINHDRYARMYDKIADRGYLYKNVKGSYDNFAYFVVDFNADPIDFKEDWENIKNDLRISNFVDRMIKTFKDREIFMEFFD
jgi:hypothetical protein